MSTPAHSRGRSFLYHLGLTLITLGVLCALFLAYQIWFTNLLQERTQNSAVASVQKTLPPPLRHIVTRPVLVLPKGPPVPLSNTTAAPGTWLGLLQIPSINVKQAIIEGTGDEELRLGPGHYSSSPALGAMGNVAIAGHRTTWGRPFRYLSELKVGDPIVITTDRASLLYRVTSSIVVSPNNVSVLGATPFPSLTLTTCNPPYSAVTRLVIHAHLTAVQRAGVSPVTTTTVPSPTTTSTTTSTTTTTEPTTTTTLAPLAANVTAAGGGGGWWPVVLYGTLLAGLLIYGTRWRRHSAHPVLVVSLIGVLCVPVTLNLFQGLSWLLPANY